MNHPQDSTKINFKERLLVWWLKFHTYTFAILQIFLRTLRRSRPSSLPGLSRENENKLYLKLIRRGEFQFDPQDCEIFMIANVCFEVRPWESDLGYDTHRVANMFIDKSGERSAHSNGELLEPVYLRWWLERIIVKRWKKEIKPSSNGCEVAFEDEDINEAIMTFVTKDI